MSDYRTAGGHAQELGDLSRPPSQPAAAIVVLAGWLSELEARWPGSEEDGRDTARLVLIQALNRRESRKSVAIPALIS